MRLRQLQRLRRAFARGARHHHLRDARLARALQHRIEVVVETVVAEVGADVDELHAAKFSNRDDALLVEAASASSSFDPCTETESSRLKPLLRKAMRRLCLRRARLPHHRTAAGDTRFPRAPSAAGAR